MTERLYYTDSSRKNFEARVQRAFTESGRHIIVLDKTCFYPEGGGQPADHGHLSGIRVTDVMQEADQVLHVVETPELKAEQRVQGSIDWERRFDHMQQHSGQHILSQAFLQTINAPTEGFHLGAETSTLDLDLKELQPEEIYEAEELANQMVFENRRIMVRLVDSEQQTHLSLRKLSERKGTIRVVEIEGFDRSACGGTHCDRTGGVGLIKVRRWEKVNQRVRVEFFCGGRALRDYRWKNRAIYALSKLYSTADREVVSAAEQRQHMIKQLRKQLRRSQEASLYQTADELLESSVTSKGLTIVSQVWEDLELKLLQKLAAVIVQGGEKRVVLFGVRSPTATLLFMRSGDLNHVDVSHWINEVAPLIEGKGGGRPDRAQAGGSRGDRLEEAVERAAELAGVFEDPAKKKNP